MKNKEKKKKYERRSRSYSGFGSRKGSYSSSSGSSSDFSYQQSERELKVMSLNIVEEVFEFAKIIWTKMKVRNQEKMKKMTIMKEMIKIFKQ